MATSGGLPHHLPPFVVPVSKDGLGHGNAALLENRPLPTPPLQLLEMHPRQLVVDQRDAFILWLRSEFAAANAIIDAMCHHLRVIGDSSDYDFVLACIQQRRFNWTMVLHMQQFYSVAEVVHALQQVALKKQHNVHNVQGRTMGMGGYKTESATVYSSVYDSVEHINSQGNNKDQQSVVPRTDVNCKQESSISRTDANLHEASRVPRTNVNLHEESPTSKTELHIQKGLPDHDSTRPSTDVTRSGQSPPQSLKQLGEQAEIKKEGLGTVSKLSGSILERISNINMNAFSKEDEDSRLSMVKVSKQFQCWEHVEGTMVNVVEGLEIYENLLTKAEASQLAFIVDQIHAAGKRGELRGHTFIVEKRTMEQSKELLQFGHTFFGDGHPGEVVEPMPLVFSSLVDRLIEWHILPSSQRPDSCCIEILQKGDSSLPSWCNRHVEPYLCSLCVLSDCTMALGHNLSLKNGDCEGAFKVLLPQGSAVVLRADISSWAILKSPMKRIMITFWKFSGSKALSTNPMPSKYAYPVPSTPLIPSMDRPYGASMQGQVPTIINHYGISGTPGVLPIPPPLQPPQVHTPSHAVPHLAGGNVQSLMASPPPVTRPPSPGIGIINPGWVAVPRTPRPPNTGTGVFFPAGGSSSSSPSRSPGPQLQAGVVLAPLDTGTLSVPASRGPRPPSMLTEQSDQLAEKATSGDPSTGRRTTAIRHKELSSPKSDPNGSKNMKDEQQQRPLHPKGSKA